MPCWYFDRKEIKNSPSFLDGIDAATEDRYRREGARFIIDAGTAMRLRYDTCATGVVYFHRFYMFHSFKEFYRYMTAACCLFLAGKVEETPKKCRDIIKVAQNLLSTRSFLRFGDDPREEVITMERILLKTIKFDLQVEHPYSFLLKYAKYFKDKDKEKTQKMAQMAWTFINDSLCTTLSLQWEAEIVAVSLMYLASRLTKFEPTDWLGRTSSKSGWWEDIIEGLSMKLMEDICHQVLDLYSSKGKKGLEDSPPASPVKNSKARPSPPPPPPARTPDKRSREATPSESAEPVVKVVHTEKEKPPPPKVTTSSVSSTPTTGPPASTTSGAPIPVAQHMTPTLSSHNTSYSSTEPLSSVSDSFTSYNPYVSSNMYTASFMSQEGSQNIQSMLAGSTAPPPTQPYSEGPPPPRHALPDTSQYPPPAATAAQYSYLPPLPQSQYTPPPNVPPPHTYPPAPTGGPPPSFDPYSLPPVPSYPPTPTSYAPPLPLSTTSPSQHSYPPPSLPLPPQPYGSYAYPPAHGTQTHVPPPPHVPPPHQPGNYHHSTMPPYNPPNPHQSYGGTSRHFPTSAGKKGPGTASRKDIPALTEIKITGRAEWNLPH